MMSKAKTRAKKSVFTTVLSLVMAAASVGAIMGFINPAARPKVNASAETSDAVIYEDFESNSVVAKDGRKYAGDFVYANEGVDLTIVDEASGNKALKFMYDVDAENDDARALVIQTRAEAWAQYKVSFYAKRANACHIAAVIRSGLPSNHYCESRRFNFDQFGDTIWGENVPDKGMLVQQIIPCDPAGNLTISLSPLKIFEHDTDLGFVIDDICVEKYAEVPEEKTNLIKNGNMEQFWDGVAWQWNDGGVWDLSPGAGLNLGWDGNAESQYSFKSASNLYLGTADGAPVWVKQNNIELKPNTEYNFGMWVREHGAGFAETDKLSFRLESGSAEAGDYYKSELVFSPSQIDADARGVAVGQYTHIGGVLKTGSAANYSFVAEYVAGQPMTWRGYQIDEATLYEADNYSAFDYAKAEKSGNVTEVADVFSAVEGDKALQANVHSDSASIVYELDVKANTYYRAAVDAQKVYGADGAFNANKPINVRVSVETAADGSGETIAKLKADRSLDKAISTLALKFNSGANEKLYLRVTADKLIDTEWQFIANNCLINFKNFSCREYTLESVSVGNAFAMDITSEKALTAIGHYDGAAFDVTADAVFEVVSGTAVSLKDNNVVSADHVGAATVKVTFGGKEATVEITVNDIVTKLEAGGDREIKLDATGTLEAVATYYEAGEKDVSATAAVAIADPEILSYEAGTFTALKVGETEVTVSFGGKSDTFVVTVPRELSSITSSENLTIEKGETQAVTITAYYNDGTSETETEGFALTTDSTAVEISGTSIKGLEETASATVKATFGGKECTINVKVVLTPTGISASDFELNFGETEQLVVTAAYANGETDVLPAASVAVEVTDKTIVEYKNGTFTALKTGETNVTVTFGQLSDTFKITVYKTLTNELAVNADITVEKDGTAIVTATANYNDGSTKVLTEGFTVTSGNTDAVTVDGVTLTAKNVGVSEITVSYTENGAKATGTFTVTVPLRITKVEIEGGDFNLALGEDKTLVVKAYYNDGTSKQVSGALLSSSSVAVTVNGFTVKANKVGEAEISAKYNGVTSEPIVVTVPKELKSVSLGEDFSVKIGGEYTLTATAIYNDGSREEITAPVIAADNGNVSVNGLVVKGVKEGQSVLTLTFEGKTVTVNAEVLNSVESISVTANDASVGGNIALTVTAVYADGTSKAITEGFTVSGDDKLVEIDGVSVKAVAEGTAALTVYFEGVSASVSVKISAAATNIEAGCGSSLAVAAPVLSIAVALGFVLIIKKRSRQ